MYYNTTPFSSLFFELKTYLLPIKTFTHEQYETITTSQTINKLKNKIMIQN